MTQDFYYDMVEALNDHGIPFVCAFQLPCGTWKGSSSLDNFTNQADSSKTKKEDILEMLDVLIGIDYD